MLLATAVEMRALDRATIEDIGIPGIALMENAGRGTAEHVWDHAGLGPGRCTSESAPHLFAILASSGWTWPIAGSLSPPRRAFPKSGTF